MVIRPSSQAIWPPRLPKTEWEMADAEFSHASGKSYSGQWVYRRKPPTEVWAIRFGDLTFKLNLTGFGHIGLFPEQAENWGWLDETVQCFHNLNVLNIFGYTGASTLISALRGAKVTHVDASKPTVTWARENQKLSGLQDHLIRWIVDDATKFLKREQRRGNRFNAVVMDPPSFGRGPKGEVWKIETHFTELLQLCREVLASEKAFFLLTTHSPGFSALSLENLLRHYLLDNEPGKIESGEMFVRDSSSNIYLPNGFYSRWTIK